MPVDSAAVILFDFLDLFVGRFAMKITRKSFLDEFVAETEGRV
jgi:hypothetical protein